MIKIIMVLCFAVANVYTAEPEIHPFPDKSNSSFEKNIIEKLDDFEKLCEKIGSIIKDPSKQKGAHHTCFLSYAWPENAQHPLRSWYDAVSMYLDKAGIHVTYDKQDFTGRVSALGDRAESASKILILLTPHYREKCDTGTTLRGEIQTAFSKGVTKRSLVLLAGSFKTSFPFSDVRGDYTPDDEMLNLMVPSGFRDQKETDGPSIDKFFDVMCNLLNPANRWGILTNVTRSKNPEENYEQICSTLVNDFRTKWQINYQESMQIPVLEFYEESAFYTKQTDGVKHPTTEYQRKNITFNHVEGIAYVENNSAPITFNFGKK